MMHRLIHGLPTSVIGLRMDMKPMRCVEKSVDILFFRIKSSCIRRNLVCWCDAWKAVAAICTTANKYEDKKPNV